MNKIFIFNTGISNLLSVRFAFEKLNYDVDIGKDLSMLSYGDTLVIPGVGHFDSIMKNIGKKNIKLIKNLIINKEVSYLGICLGLQILFENSSEGNMSGLGLIKGGVEKLSTKFEDSQIPETHIGWKNVHFTDNSKFKNYDKKMFYFVHQYFVNPVDEHIINSTIELYNKKVVVGILKDNIGGIQFHPEKSGETGLEFLDFMIKEINGKN